MILDDLLCNHNRFSFRAFLNDVDMNISDYDGRTPLHLVAAEGC